MPSRTKRLLTMLVLLATLIAALGTAIPAAAVIEAPVGDCTETGSGINLYDQDCYLYDIDPNRGYISDGIEDAYDSFGDLAIDGVDYSSETPGTLVGRTVVIPVVSMSGLNVHREVFVPATGGTYARWYDELHNPTGAPITVDILNGQCSLGSDSDTVIQATSSGDLIVSAADYWSVSTDEPTPTFDDPVVGIVVDGLNGLDRVDYFFYEDGEDCAEWEWQNVTVQPGATIAYVSFTIQQESRAEAQAEAERLSTDPVAWSDGLTSEQIARVQNFPALPVREMHVASIVLALSRISAECSPVGAPCVIASVTIVDQDGVPVSGATVQGTFKVGTGVPQPVSGVTDANGVAKLKVRASSRGRTTYTFTVTNVTKAPDGTYNYTYDPSANAVTTKSFVY